MLYASCKQAFVASLKNFNLDPEQLASVEIDSASEVAHEALYLEIHPETVQHVKKVSDLGTGICC